MSLSKFTADLFRDGNVIAANTIKPIHEEDRVLCAELLKQFYKHDINEMPGIAPAFHQASALWAVEMIYRSVQFIILRAEEATVIESHLKFYDKFLDADVVYSADLSLRFLPDIFNLAKALSPEDILVKKLKQLAVQWPLSSVGTNLDGQIIVNENIILTHPSLRVLYTDRIIEHKDHTRLKNQKVAAAVSTALGNFQDQFWPDYADALP